MTCCGTEWDEHLDGGKGKDKLFGGNGRDTLDGGRDNDLLVGGPHEDAFCFASKLGRGNVDKIKDFSPYYDRIELGIGVSTGTVAAAQIVPDHCPLPTTRAPKPRSRPNAGRMTRMGRMSL